MDTGKLCLWLFCAAASLWGDGSQQRTSLYNAQNPPIAIELDDRGHIGRKALDAATRLADDVLSHGGLSPHWVTGVFPSSDMLLTQFRAETNKPCGRPLEAGKVRAVILPRAPSSLPLNALGFASPCELVGVQVVLYADRLESVSRKNLASFYRVLAYALVHEIGHVLLRSGVHDSSGVMKAVWGKSDWQRAAVDLILFSPEERAWIRQELLQLASPKPYRVPQPTANNKLMTQALCDFEPSPQ